MTSSNIKAEAEVEQVSSGAESSGGTHKASSSESCWAECIPSPPHVVSTVSYQNRRSTWTRRSADLLAIFHSGALLVALPTNPRSVPVPRSSSMPSRRATGTTLRQIAATSHRRLMDAALTAPLTIVLASHSRPDLVCTSIATMGWTWMAGWYLRPPCHESREGDGERRSSNAMLRPRIVGHSKERPIHGTVTVAS